MVTDSTVSLPVVWPMGGSPTLRIVSPSQANGKWLHRVPISVSKNNLHVGKYTVPLSEVAVKVRQNMPLIVKGNNLEVEIGIPSWIEGKLDTQLTVLLGCFIQAGKNGNLDRMLEIVLNFQRMRRFEIAVFALTCLGGTPLFGWIIFSDLPDWSYFIFGCALVGCPFSLRAWNRRKSMKKLNASVSA